MKPALLAALLALAPLAGRAGPVETEAAWQRPFSEVAGLPARPPDRTVPYGPEPSQFAELWLPPGSNGALPVVVLIHGGCWLADYGIAHIRPLAAALADAGFAVWALEYRRVGEPGGGYPGTFRDVAAGVDRLAAAGEPRLDPARSVIAGHSAGGHLALWAAARSKLPASDPLRSDAMLVPRGALGLAAIADLAAYAAGDNGCQRVAPRLLGGMPRDVADRYARTSPAELGVAAPTVLLQGGADAIVPPAQAGALPGARVVLLPEAGHFDLIHPGTPAWPRIVAALEELLADEP